ncbi:hypothetical protein [uncultured Methylobacterium sp.]|uniref:hypothetical protein n=1 Tax=uncultured Methylobacterium sp. TaxID=157278 RepID=UPI0035CA549E
MDLTFHPIALRRHVEKLVRTTDRTLAAIAQETGLCPGTMGHWNFRWGWRPPAHKPRRRNDPARWSASRHTAVERLYRNPDVELSDLAAALGVGRYGASAFFKGCGFGSRPRPPRTVRTVGTGGDLRAALRGHVARQVERFDAALKGKAPFDSSKVLRDLGGLKRLLDDLDADERVKELGDEADAGKAERAAGFAALDLPALRAQIARRYAAFASERADAALPGEPAAFPDPRPLP